MAASNYITVTFNLPRAALQQVVQLAEESACSRGLMLQRLVEEALEHGWGRPPDRTPSGNNGRLRKGTTIPVSSAPSKQVHMG